MSSTTVSEVVQAFSTSFKTIDLRIVAVAPEDHWINVISSVFLSSKSQEEIKSEQQQAKDGLPKTNEFCVFFVCYPFEKLYDLFEQIKKGEVRLYRTHEIKFREFDPSELRVLSYLPPFLEEMEEWRLAGSEGMGQEENGKNLWPIVESQNGKAIVLGFKDIYDLINEKLRIRAFYQQGRRDLVIGIPIPARIANVSLVGSSIEIETKVFPSEDLQLNLSIRRVPPRKHQSERVWKKTELVKKCKLPPERHFCYATNSIQLTDLRPHDRIEIELIHRQAPTLTIDETHLEVPLENTVEPFAKALNNFCPLDVFKKRLLAPERCKEGKTKPQDIFENAVAWLLSLVGFSVLSLGGGYFERLKIPTTGVEIGSIDMIAYQENECLLFIDCDIKIPDDKKIRSMMTVKEHFRFLQDEHRRPDIVSAIFSPKDCTGISVDRQHVKIVDRHQITRMFEEAMKGNPEQARSSLIY